MNRTQHLQEILRLEALAAAATARARVHRDELSTEARAEYEREGTAPTWRDPGLATMTLAVSKEALYVTDEAALLEWVRDRYTREVETVEQVRPGFRAQLLADAVVDEAGVVDPVIGEVMPGVGVRPAGVAQSLTIRPSRDAKAVFTAIGERMLNDLLTPPVDAEDHLS